MKSWPEMGVGGKNPRILNTQFEKVIMNVRAKQLRKLFWQLNQFSDKQRPFRGIIYKEWKNQQVTTSE